MNINSPAFVVSFSVGFSAALADFPSIVLAVAS